jgi:hypothetical protein
MFTATLRCGTLLSYEVRTFQPNPGDLVPCRLHGYCAVQLTGGSTGGRALPPRARPRTQSELLDWLRGRPETTVHALRRQGFTLRMVVAAERDGVVDVDLRAGRVVVRSVIDAANAVPDGTARG